MRRREFLTVSGLTAAFGTAAGGAGAADESIGGGRKACAEPARRIPVVDRTEVVVCGAGPAGISAAIAAARKGASVRLIELHGFPGGVWTAGMVNNVIDYQNKDGLIDEIMSRCAKTAAQIRKKVFDIEAMKIVLERMIREAGVRPLYQSRVVSAVKDESNRLTHAIVENKSGRQAFAAKVFVDATGDGDLSAQAGCNYSLGHPVTGKVQPMSMIALLGGLDYRELNERKFVRGDGVSAGEAKDALFAEMDRAGVTPSYSRPTLFRIREDHFAMMANHEYGVSGIDAQEMTDATMDAREEIHGMVDALRGLGGVWKDIQVLATSPQIGVREGRRIHGRYTVGKEDLVQGARFDDAVCRARFCVDIHALDSRHAGGGTTTEGVRAVPYDIPLRSLIAKEVDGLMLTGRCISGDFFAHASYRVTGNAVPLGEAAGRTAAVAAQTGRLPHQVGIDEIRGS